MNATLQTGLVVVTQFALKLLGAIVLWIVGRALIRFATSMMGHALDRQALDATVVGYLRSALSILLNVILVVALLGFFGVETASFAALLAGVGIAVGVAWSGLLASFAAGVFLLVLRPFKVGDYIEAGGVTGTVESIGLFATILNTPANVIAIVGNSKVFGDNIMNYTRNDYRRVDMTAQLSHDVNPEQAILLLKDALARIPNVLATPAPVVEISRVQPGRTAAGRASLLRQRQLLAGLFRYQPPHPEHLQHSWLSGAGAPLPTARHLAGGGTAGHAIRRLIFMKLIFMKDAP